jgi:SulP family sulfate permease
VSYFRINHYIDPGVNVYLPGADLKHIQRPATTLILRMGNVPFVDATGIFAIEEIITGFKRHGAGVLLEEVRPNVRFKLERGGVIAHVGADNVIDTLELALLRAKELQAPNAQTSSTE